MMRQHHPRVDALLDFTCADMAGLIDEFVAPPATVDELIELMTPPMIKARNVPVPKPCTRNRWKIYVQSVYDILRPAVHEFARFT